MERAGNTPFIPSSFTPIGGQSRSLGMGIGAARSASTPPTQGPSGQLITRSVAPPPSPSSSIAIGGVLPRSSESSKSGLDGKIAELKQTVAGLEQTLKGLENTSRAKEFAVNDTSQEATNIHQKLIKAHSSLNTAKKELGTLVEAKVSDLKTKISSKETEVSRLKMVGRKPEAELAKAELKTLKSELESLTNSSGPKKEGFFSILAHKASNLKAALTPDFSAGARVSSLNQNPSLPESPEDMYGMVAAEGARPAPTTSMSGSAALNEVAKAALGKEGEGIIRKMNSEDQKDFSMKVNYLADKGELKAGMSFTQVRDKVVELSEKGVFESDKARLRELAETDGLAANMIAEDKEKTAVSEPQVMKRELTHEEAAIEARERATDEDLKQDFSDVTNVRVKQEPTLPKGGMKKGPSVEKKGVGFSETADVRVGWIKKTDFGKADTVYNQATGSPYADLKVPIDDTIANKSKKPVDNEEIEVNSQKAAKVDKKGKPLSSRLRAQVYAKKDELIAQREMKKSTSAATTPLPPPPSGLGAPKEINPQDLPPPPKTPE